MEQAGLTFSSQVGAVNFVSRARRLAGYANSNMKYFGGECDPGSREIMKEKI